MAMKKIVAIIGGGIGSKKCCTPEGYPGEYLA